MPLTRLVNGVAVEVTAEEMELEAAHEAALVEEAQTRDLTKPQFEWLLAYTGLDEVWDALEATLKTTDRAKYATLKLQRNQTNFRLSVTLQFISDLSSVISQVAPDTDLSEPTIRAAWAQALAVSTKAS